MPRPILVKEVIPNPSKLINSLRDFGYELTQAIADLVDNSLDAGATEVRVDVRYDAENSWIRVADNGRGMTSDEITEAMRYGANRAYSGEDKGKFGLGLKTASLSQCRRLTVGTRMSSNRAPEVRVLDLDHVMESGRWEVKTVSDSVHLREPMKKLKSGTIVLWENLDRVLQYKRPQGKRAEDGILRHAEKVEAHLAMVFHRFLAGTAGTPRKRRKLAIWINDRPVDPWDPFATDEPHTKEIQGGEYEVTSSQGRGVVLFRPFILPTRRQFSSITEFNRLAGPEKWNQQQGLYVYRADRLIQCGGWCRMAVVDEHTKFARAALEFNPDLDDAFAINVTKTYVKLPADLKEQLDKPLKQLREIAKKAYSKNDGADTGEGRKASPSTGKRPVPPSPGLVEPKAPPRPTAGAREQPSPPPGRPPAPRISARTALEKAASKVGQAKALRAIVTELKSTFPGVADDLGW